MKDLDKFSAFGMLLSFILTMFSSRWFLLLFVISWIPAMLKEVKG